MKLGAGYVIVVDQHHKHRSGNQHKLGQHESFADNGEGMWTILRAGFA
jgi:hypothetical protein